MYFHALLIAVLLVLLVYIIYYLYISFIICIYHLFIDLIGHVQIVCNGSEVALLLMCSIKQLIQSKEDFVRCWSEQSYFSNCSKYICKSSKNCYLSSTLSTTLVPYSCRFFHRTSNFMYLFKFNETYYNKICMHFSASNFDKYNVKIH